MKELRGPLPLDDRDFEEIRARVVEKIEKPRGVHFAIPAFALAAAAALVFVLLPHRHAPRPAAFGMRRPAAFAAPTVPREQTPQPIQLAEKAAPGRRTPKASGTPPADEEITMEIHTADPDVRIIWIGSR